MMPDAYGRIRRDNRRWTRLLLAAVAWAAVLALYILYVPSHISPLKLPGPAQLISAQRQMGWTILHHAQASLTRATLGFAIGSLLGLLTAVLMFASRPVRAVLHPFLACLAPVPPLALSPFLILWFRLSYAAQIGLIALGSFMILSFSTYQALDLVNLDLRRATWSLGSRGVSHYVGVLVPAILPALVGPFRISLASALSLSTVSEFLGAQEGLGVLVMVARRTLETPTILLAIVSLGLMSFILDLILRKTLKRITHWN